MTSLPNPSRINIASAGLLAATLLWAGMILGVSVLATPAKFLAPSLSLPVALDIGRQTFGIFNQVEFAWSLTLIGLGLLAAPPRWVYGAIGLSCAIVAVETAWLLPLLDARVEAILAGGNLPGSRLHLVYILLELLKLAALLVLASGMLCRPAGATRPPSAISGPNAGRSSRRPARPTAARSNESRVFGSWFE